VLVLGQVESLPDSLRGRFESYPGLAPELRIFIARGE
jgi:hypothetical protein